MLDVFSNSLGEEELEAVNAVFYSKWLGSGNETKLLEKEFGDYISSEPGHTLMLNSATSALGVGVKSLNITPGSTCVIPVINFVACPWAILDAGLNVKFCDVDKETLNATGADIANVIDKYTSSVLLLHYGGHPCDYDSIQGVLGGRDIVVIEDAANAVSSSYNGIPCGTLGDMGVWSFDAMKMLVMGDGGALWLRNSGAVELAKSYRYLGLSPKTTSGMDSAKEKNSRWWEYDLKVISGRYTTNDILSCIGRVQLKRLQSFIDRRKAIWTYYKSELNEIGDLVLPPEPLEGCTSSYYLFWIQTRFRDGLAKWLMQNEIYSTFRYYPLHKVNLFQRFVECGQKFPNAEYVNQRTLNIPIHQNLTESDIAYIVEKIKESFKGKA